MRRLFALLAVTTACDSPKDPAATAFGRPPAQAAPPISTASLDAAASDSVSPGPLTPQAEARLEAAASTLKAAGCDAEAFDEIRALQRTHGDPPPLIEAQTVAYQVCEDPLANAELLARTLPDDATADARLRVGAAWLRATRYDDALAVLEPLAQSEGPTSKAAWLAGFGLFHAGQSSRARPLLESARAQAPEGRADAWLLIGLCKLHDGDIEGAIAELEAGTQAVTDDPSLGAALSRAYAAGGRTEDATRAEAQARAAHDARARVERTQARLAANAKAFQRAAEAQDIDAVERTFDRMWDDAPKKLRLQLLQVRAGVYAHANLEDQANADRARAKALVATTPADPGKTP